MRERREAWKVHRPLDNRTDFAACGLAVGLAVNVGGRVVGQSIWPCVPREAQCAACHEAWPTCASRADALSVAIFCGALAGALDSTIRALIADYLAHGDPSPILDLAEQRGLHEGGYGPERYEEWAEATEHVHVWLPWESGDDGRGLRRCRDADDIARVRRCPCGVFEYERSILRSSSDDTIEMRARYWGSVVTQPWPWPRGPFDI